MSAPHITPKITVVGSVNLDLVATADRLPAPGETVLGGRFASHPGGKGANQALAARRLGADVSLIAKVGRDPNADLALALLKADGVDLSKLQFSDSEPTGVALIAVAADGENQILVAPGANAALTPDDLPGRIDGALIGQHEVPLETLTAAVARCEGFVALNLAPAMATSPEVLKRADLLIVNETEAAFYGEATLLASGGLVAVTLGARGAVLYRDGQEVARTAPPRVEVIDATGAGDTFTAALTVALLERREPEAALRFACAAGALATTKAGAQPSLPWREDVDALI
jgi:ribokinase